MPQAAVNEFGLPDVDAQQHTPVKLGGPGDFTDSAICLQACCLTFLEPCSALLNLADGDMCASPAPPALQSP